MERNIRIIEDLVPTISRPKQLMNLLKSVEGQPITEKLKYQLAEFNCEIIDNKINISLYEFNEQEQDELLFLVEQHNIKRLLENM